MRTASPMPASISSLHTSICENRLPVVWRQLYHTRIEMHVLPSCSTLAEYRIQPIRIILNCVCKQSYPFFGMLVQKLLPIDTVDPDKTLILCYIFSFINILMPHLSCHLLICTWVGEREHILLVI